MEMFVCHRCTRPSILINRLIVQFRSKLHDLLFRLLKIVMIVQVVEMTEMR